MSLEEPAIPGLPDQESYVAPDTTGFPVDTGYELDDNTYALAIAAKTIRFLTCNLRGAESDIDKAAQLAEARLHTDHTVSHKGYIAAVLDHVVRTPWFEKHGATAKYIAAIDSQATIQWVDDGSKEVLLINGVAEKRVSSRNAELYRAYRLAHHPAASLCNVALSGSNTFQSTSYTASNVFEMHIEKTITAAAACDHAKTLSTAIRALRSI